MKQILKYVILNLQENLKFAESKHSIALALASGVIVFGATFLNSDFVAVKIFSCLSIIFCAIAIGVSAISLSSRKVDDKKRIKKKPKLGSLLYFGDICHYDEESYLNEIKKVYGLPKQYKPDGFDHDLAKFIIATSRVVEKKHEYFSFVIMFMFSGVVSLGLCCVFAGVLL